MGRMRKSREEDWTETAGLPKTEVGGMSNVPSQHTQTLLNVPTINAGQDQEQKIIVLC